MPALSPVHHLLEPLGPHWSRIGDAPIAAHFGALEAEVVAAQALGLCDLSALPQLGVKGPAADPWLRQQGVEVPAELYEVRALGDGGLIGRVAADEFFLESGTAGRSVPDLAERLATVPGGAYRVERHSAAFLLSGSRRLEVMAQTCGVNLAEAAPRRLIYSRVAVTSCGLLPDRLNGAQVLRLWVEPSLAVYLWQTLAEISGELGGRIVGASCFYPDLTA